VMDEYGLTVSVFDLWVERMTYLFSNEIN